MPAGATYEPIATTTVTSATTVSFSSIPSTYTDLVCIVVAKYNLANAAYAWNFQVNSTGGTSYSETIVYGNNTSILSTRGSGDSAFRPTEICGNGTAAFTFMRLDFFSYSNTSTNKTIFRQLSSDRIGNGAVDRSAGLFRSTSAISSIQFSPFGTNYAVGSTFTLYGIKAA